MDHLSQTSVRIVAGAFCLVDRRGRIVRATRFGTHFWAAGKGSWSRTFGAWANNPVAWQAQHYAGFTEQKVAV